jgi:hypothetical protein
MPDYRIYSVNSQNHIDSPLTIITCIDDEEAVEHAKQLKQDLDLELWQETRLVARIGSTRGSDGRSRRLKVSPRAH